MVKRVDKAPVDLDQRYHLELLSSFLSTVVLFAQRFLRMRVWAILVVHATPAVQAGIAAAAVSIGALLVVFDP